MLPIHCSLVFDSSSSSSWEEILLLCIELILEGGVFGRFLSSLGDSCRRSCPTCSSLCSESEMESPRMSDLVDSAASALEKESPGSGVLGDSIMGRTGEESPNEVISTQGEENVGDSCCNAWRFVHVAGFMSNKRLCTSRAFLRIFRFFVYSGSIRRSTPARTAA